MSPSKTYEVNSSSTVTRAPAAIPAHRGAAAAPPVRRGAAGGGDPAPGVRAAGVLPGAGDGRHGVARLVGRPRAAARLRHRRARLGTSARRSSC